MAKSDANDMLGGILPERVVSYEDREISSRSVLFLGGHVAGRALVCIKKG